MLNDSSNEEISKLNQFVRYEGKKAKDLMLYEDVLVAGRGFRFTNFDDKGEEDEAPFSIINVDNKFCEVIYSSKLGNEQVFSVLETPMETIMVNQETGVPSTLYYSNYTVYLRNRAIEIDGKSG